MKMSSKEASTVMATVKAQTNIQWRQEANQAFIITGSLTEIQNAHKCLLEIVEQRVRSPQSSDLNSYGRYGGARRIDKKAKSNDYSSDVGDFKTFPRTTATVAHTFQETPFGASACATGSRSCGNGNFTRQAPKDRKGVAGEL